MNVPKTLWAAVFLLMGIGAATYLHWPALADPLVYKSDVRQQPHWAAYHTDTFRDDDLLVRLGQHNQSPVQNLIYYVGTFVVDMVWLGKLLAVISYGLIAALFFWIGHSMFGTRGGAIAAFSITFLPDQFEYCAGGFSKAFMIPLILVCVFLLERGKWKWLLVLLPFGAAAYPVCAVLMGAVALTDLLLEAPERGKRTLPALAYLSGASALAVAVLSVKYFFPPEGIGPLAPGSVLRTLPEMHEGGMWAYLPLSPLMEELSRRAYHPFVLASALVFLVFLGRQRIWWNRTMTALLLASMAFYLLASKFFMDLYLPNRYTRYSVPVLLALFLGANWDRVIARIPWRSARPLTLGCVLFLGAYAYRDSFRMGKDTSSRHEWAPLNRFVATLPGKILVAGHPMYMDDIPIQARRSVLCNYKLSHPWYTDYYAEIRRRTEATFDALYAREAGPVNRLSGEWGVTHLVVVKRYFNRARTERRDTYVAPYNDYIRRIAHPPGEFLLSHPPRQSIEYEDEVYVIRLPIDETAFP